MNELKQHEIISMVIKGLSIVLLILPMYFTVVTVKLSNSNLFSIDLTTISANVKLDIALSQSAQDTIKSSFNSIAFQHMVLTALAILLLIISIFLNYINKRRSSGVLTIIAGLFTFLLFIRYFVVSSLNGQAAANLSPNTYVVTFGLGFYFLTLVTPLLIISALVKFVIKK